jgi:predicted amidohydrolase
MMLGSLLGVFALTGRSSTPAYRAAVVEFAPKLAPNQSLSDAAAKAHNLENFVGLATFVAAAAANKSDIVVLPEYGITGDGTLGRTASHRAEALRIPTARDGRQRRQDWQDFTRNGIAPFGEQVPSVGSSPCGGSAAALHPVTSAAACLARKHSIVLVLDLIERVPCAACADGRLQYNTAIALDEHGVLLAKYRKYALFGTEPTYLDRPLGQPSNGTWFDTSFGVRFGLFICYDLLWQMQPRSDLGHFAFPTEWVNAAPGEQASEAQRLWTSAHQRVLLASNYGGWGNESSGSGIWRNGEPLAAFSNPTSDPRSVLLVADVPV